MNRKGFALIEILIVVAVIALLAGGGWYVAHLKNEQAAVTNGRNAEQQAKQAVQQVNQLTQQEQNAMDQITGNAGQK
jgi:prepilin-type N-terminal cleavage/methylation domain-containing protein